MRKAIVIPTSFQPERVPIFFKKEGKLKTASHHFPALKLLLNSLWLDISELFDHQQGGGREKTGEIRTEHTVIFLAKNLYIKEKERGRELGNFDVEKTE